MGALSGSASTEIDRPIDVVYKLVEDVEIAPTWQEGLDSMEVLDRDADGRPSRVRTKSDAKVKMITSEVKFTYEENAAVRWEQLKGDTKSVKGAWLLEDLGDGRTKVTYDLQVDPGRMLGMLVKGPVEGVVRGILVNGRPDELKQLAESQ